MVRAGFENININHIMEGTVGFLKLFGLYFIGEIGLLSSLYNKRVSSKLFEVFFSSISMFNCVLLNYPFLSLDDILVDYHSVLITCRY